MLDLPESLQRRDLSGYFSHNRSSFKKWLKKMTYFSHLTSGGDIWLKELWIYVNKPQNSSARLIG